MGFFSSLGQPSVATVTPAEAQQWIMAGKATLVDVREASEHASERIAGAHLVPLSSFDPTKAAACVKPGTKLVLHCKAGKRSADAATRAAALVKQGIEVYSMTGGIDGWKQAGLQVETGSKA